MHIIQTVCILAYGTISLFVFVKSIIEVRNKHTSQSTHLLFPLGIFVWGDGVVIGLFWFIDSIISLLLKDWMIFLCSISVFWVVRSMGEVQYWLNQQFSPCTKEPPEKLWGYSFFKSNAIWYVFQVFWQCMTVASIMASLILIKEFTR